MKVINNAEIDATMNEENRLAEITEQEASSAVLHDSMIATYIKHCFDRARSYKEQGAETRILDNMRQIDGQYNPDKLAQIRNVGGSEVFMMITDAKCKNAAFWVQDILFQPGQKPWGIEPTPIPELPDDIKRFTAEAIFNNVLMNIQQEIMATGVQPDVNYIEQQIANAMPDVEKAVKDEIVRVAKERAKAVEQSVDDKLIEGGWYAALNKAIPNIIMHTGFIKGPIDKKRKITKVVTGEDGRLVKQIVDDIYPTWESRHPLYIYPAPGSTGIDDGYLIDRVKMTPIALQELLGVPGYNDDEIMSVLEEYEGGKLFEWLPVDQDFADINEEESVSYDSDKIDCLEFWGTVRGSYLLDWGLELDADGAPVQEMMFYHIKAYLIGTHVIGIQYNSDPAGRKPYYKDSFENRDGSFWGKGLPEVIADVQQVCNSMARAIANNAAMGSGPQCERNIDRIPAYARDDDKLVPWKVWDSTSDMMSTGPAISFFQPPMVVERLLSVYTAFNKIADEHSGVPGFAHGDPQVGGAGNALANYEKILTPDGPIPIGDIKPGDNICTIDGKTTKVIKVFPQGETDIFRLKFGNGEYVDCDLNHRWMVRSHHDRKFQVLTTEQILEKGLFRKTTTDYRNPHGWRPKWMLPIVKRVEFAKKKVAIDPYTMGALIGDGDYRCRLTSEDSEIFSRIPYELGKIDTSYRGKARTQAIKGIKKFYHSYGLNCKSTEKFIPKEYLFNSYEVRIELLRGLMDTDGCCSKQGETFFSTSSFELACDFTKLVRSLGGIVNSIYQEEGKQFSIKGREATRTTNYRIVFNLPGEKIFHLNRKQSRVKQRNKTHTYITGIEYVGKSLATCITVDSKDGLFLCENYIPTHNTATGLNMLMGAAARGIRGMVKSIDENIIKPSIERQYFYVVDKEQNFGFICDYQIVTSGSAAALVKEQMATRRIEFMNATANPIDAQILGLEGRKYLLEETAKSIQLDLKRVFPVAPPQQLMGPANPPPPEKTEELDASGNPVAGQDNRMFNETPKIQR